MSEQEALIISENSNIVLRTDKNQSPVDILNRQPEVDRLLNLINTLSNANSSCTFAINGKWGCGKTFLLDMLKRQLMDWKGGTAYTVISYNCWQYDYYDEPLVAILSAMLDSIDEVSHLLKPELREKLATVKNFVKFTVKDAISTIIKNKTGIDIEEIQNTLDAASDKAKNEHPDDEKSSIKKAISSVREELKKLAKDQSIIIIIDELDRCLPEYSIKVLERLHHLFSEIPNVFTVLAVDDTQLKNTVRMIFGEEVDINAYLKKFIDFNIQLDVGTVNERFIDKYTEYFSLYGKSVLDEWDDLENYLTALFSGIDIRTQEHIMNKITTIHRLLFRDEKKDCSFMCFELLLAVYYRTNSVGTKSEGNANTAISGSSQPIDAPLDLIVHPSIFSLYSNTKQPYLKVSSCLPNSFQEYFNDRETIFSTGYTITTPKNTIGYVDESVIERKLLFYSERLFGINKIIIENEEIPSLIPQFQQIRTMLTTIR